MQPRGIDELRAADNLVSQWRREFRELAAMGSATETITVDNGQDECQFTEVLGSGEDLSRNN
jgi:hypothetical protein